MCGEHLQELNAVHLTRFRTYEIALPPQRKPRKGVGFRQINMDKHLPLRPFTGQFLRKADI